MPYINDPIPTPEGFPYPLAHDGTQAQETVNKLLIRYGAYCFHEEGSPYVGLTTSEQRILASVRRPKGRTPKYVLAKMRKARKEDYTKILLSCTQALTWAWYNDDTRLDRINVFIHLPYNWRKYYDKTIPRGFPVAFYDWSVIMSWRVDKFMDWMYKAGHSTYDCKRLRKQIWALAKEQEKFAWYFKYAAPISIVELYDQTIQWGETAKIARKDKGRNNRKLKDMKKVVDNKE